MMEMSDWKHDSRPCIHSMVRRVPVRKVEMADACTVLRTRGRQVAYGNGSCQQEMRWLDGATHPDSRRLLTVFVHTHAHTNPPRAARNVT